MIWEILFVGCIFLSLIMIVAERRWHINCAEQFRGYRQMRSKLRSRLVQLIYWSLASRDYSRSKLCLLSYQLRSTTLIDSPISHLVFLFNPSILVSKTKSLLPSYCYSKAMKSSLFCLFHYGWGRFPNYMNG